MKKVLIFPAPLLIKEITADQQNDYMFSLLKDEMTLEWIGDFIEVNALNKSDYCEEVCRMIAEQKPDWLLPPANRLRLVSTFISKRKS